MPCAISCCARSASRTTATLPGTGSTPDTPPTSPTRSAISSRARCRWCRATAAASFLIRGVAQLTRRSSAPRRRPSPRTHARWISWTCWMAPRSSWSSRRARTATSRRRRRGRSRKKSGMRSSTRSSSVSCAPSRDSRSSPRLLFPRRPKKFGPPWERRGRFVMFASTISSMCPSPASASPSPNPYSPSPWSFKPPAPKSVTERTPSDLTGSRAEPYLSFPMKKKHAERRWTVMVVPHGSGASRAVEISQTVLKALVGLGGVIALLVLVLRGAALSRGANILVRSLSEAYDSASSQRARYAATPSIMPTKGWLTSAFAAERVHPILHLARPHEGIDVSAPMGAEIEAPAGGVITQVSWVEGYGNMLTLDHGYGLVTRYAHCSKIMVTRGQRVKRGQKIELVGSTGLSTGPHLTYEVWVTGSTADPLTYILPDAIVD